MTGKSIFLKLYLWLASTDVFGRLSKKIPGKWKLYEYYRDSGNDLIHVREPYLKKINELLWIEFSDDEEFSLKTNLPISLFQTVQGRWNVRRNFITLTDSSDFRNNIEFQYAFEKGMLKLLKKDRFGKIEFFGFFARIDAKN